jgi:hypothetical protein
MFLPFKGHKDGLSKYIYIIGITYKLTLECAWEGALVYSKDVGQYY